MKAWITSFFLLFGFAAKKCRAQYYPHSTGNFTTLSVSGDSYQSDIYSQLTNSTTGQFWEITNQDPIDGLSIPSVPALVEQSYFEFPRGVYSAGTFNLSPYNTISPGADLVILSSQSYLSSWSALEILPYALGGDVRANQIYISGKGNQHEGTPIVLQATSSIVEVGGDDINTGISSELSIEGKNSNSPIDLRLSDGPLEFADGTLLNSTDSLITLASSPTFQGAIGGPSLTINNGVAFPGGNFTVGVDTLVVANGNIGIGTTTPSAPLEISGQNSNGTGLVVDNKSLFNVYWASAALLTTSFSNTTGWTAIPNALSFTSHGYPVYIDCHFSENNSAAAYIYTSLQEDTGLTNIYGYFLQPGVSATGYFPASISGLLFPTAGTHTYQLAAQVSGGTGTIDVYNSYCEIFEL